ncbi:helix-turn-helix domain-containing protein [Marinomonas agarivorans]|nr:helix-turn-helix domain-containing protein [Marinomonas agarivorans]
MYHYTECGLPNIYLKNGFITEKRDEKGSEKEQNEEYTSIHDMENLHTAIAQSITDSHTALSAAEFKFLRIELNLSQKLLGQRFGVSEQTIARYEKGQSDIPRTTDAALRSLYMEKVEKNSPVSFFLDLLSNAEAQQEKTEIQLEEINDQWRVTG